MKSKLQQLREAIIKEIPEIKGTREVSCFSCGGIGRFETPHGDAKYEDCSECSGSGYQEEECIKRPITLADVLRVVIKIEMKKTKYDDVLDSSTIRDLLRFWDLIQNDLSLQSEETINFLSKIILKGDE